MDVTPLILDDRPVITHYGNGGFTVSKTVHKGNVLILSDRVITWEVSSLNEATAESFAPLFAGDLPEIVLVGAGPKFATMPERLRALFRERRIAADVMDTGAACRTYGVLLAEGRHVAAALIAV